MTSALTRVAITGMGCVCRAGENLSQAMKAMLQGPPPPAPPSRLSMPAGTAPVFEAPLPDVRDWDRSPPLSNTVRFAFASALEAMADAGWSKEDFTGRKVGVCLGSTTGASLHFFKYYQGRFAGEHHRRVV